MFTCVKPNAALQLFSKPRWCLFHMPVKGWSAWHKPTKHLWNSAPLCGFVTSSEPPTHPFSSIFSPPLGFLRVSNFQLLFFCERSTTENKRHGLQMVSAARLKRGVTLSLCCSAQTDERTVCLTDWLIDWLTSLISCMWNSSVRLAGRARRVNCNVCNKTEQVIHRNIRVKIGKEK